MVMLVTLFSIALIGLFLLPCQHDDDDEWGTYRGNLYFGMRARRPQSLMTGLMWFGIPTFKGIGCNETKHYFFSNQTFV